MKKYNINNNIVFFTDALFDKVKKFDIIKKKRLEIIKLKNKNKKLKKKKFFYKFSKKFLNIKKKENVEILEKNFHINSLENRVNFLSFFKTVVIKKNFAFLNKKQTIERLKNEIIWTFIGIELNKLRIIKLNLRKQKKEKELIKKKKEEEEKRRKEEEYEKEVIALNAKFKNVPNYTKVLIREPPRTTPSRAEIFLKQETLRIHFYRSRLLEDRSKQVPMSSVPLIFYIYSILREGNFNTFYDFYYILKLSLLELSTDNINFIKIILNLLFKYSFKNQNFLTNSFVYFKVLSNKINYIAKKMFQNGEHFSWINLERFIKKFKKFRKFKIPRLRRVLKRNAYKKYVKKLLVLKYKKHLKITFFKSKLYKHLFRYFRNRAIEIINDKTKKVILPVWFKNEILGSFEKIALRVQVLKYLNYLSGFKLLSFLVFFAKTYTNLGLKKFNYVMSNILLRQLKNPLFIKKFISFLFLKLKSNLKIVKNYLYQKLFFAHKHPKLTGKLSNKLTKSFVHLRTKYFQLINFDIKIYMIKFFNSFIKKGKKNIVRTILVKIIKILKFMVKHNFNILYYFKQIFFKIKPLILFKKYHLGKNLNIIPFFYSNKLSKNWDANRRFSRIGISWLLNSIKLRKEKTLLLRIVNEFCDLNKDKGNTILLKKKFYLNFYESRSYKRLLKFVTWV